MRVKLSWYIFAIVTSIPVMSNIEVESKTSTGQFFKKAVDKLRRMTLKSKNQSFPPLVRNNNQEHCDNEYLLPPFSDSNRDIVVEPDEVSYSLQYYCY